MTHPHPLVRAQGQGHDVHEGDDDGVVQVPTPSVRRVKIPKRTLCHYPQHKLQGIHPRDHPMNDDQHKRLQGGLLGRLCRQHHNVKQNADGDETFEILVGGNVVAQFTKAVFGRCFLQPHTLHHSFGGQPTYLTFGQQRGPTELPEIVDDDADEYFQHEKRTNEHEQDKKQGVATGMVPLRLQPIFGDVHGTVHDVQPPPQRNDAAQGQHAFENIVEGIGGV